MWLMWLVHWSAGRKSRALCGEIEGACEEVNARSGSLCETQPVMVIPCIPVLSRHPRHRIMLEGVPWFGAAFSILACTFLAFNRCGCPLLLSEYHLPGHRAIVAHILVVAFGLPSSVSFSMHDPIVAEVWRSPNRLCCGTDRRRDQELCPSHLSQSCPRDCGRCASALAWAALCGIAHKSVLGCASLP